jgi:hypothetical protein
MTFTSAEALSVAYGYSSVASFGLLSVGACLGFLTAALFAAGAEPADLPKPKKVVSIPDDSAEMVSQAAANLYALGASHPQGREARRPASAGADQVRVGDQPQDREDNGPYRAGDAARPRRRGN